jgi:hypothetical protein
MSQASREREKARRAALGQAPYEREPRLKGVEVEISKARLDDIPAGKIADTVRELAAHYPEGFCVKNRDEWGWIVDTGEGITLMSVDATGGIQPHVIPPGMIPISV